MKTLTGSPHYCSPEVITRDSYDNKVDLWSLGIVAIEMAETKVPYSNMDPLQVIFRIPKEVTGVTINISF
jgi:serine/threonine protein kinase